MSTHNICFHGEINKILHGYPLLSVSMHMLWFLIILEYFNICFCQEIIIRGP